jgi:hypothetical protein
MDDMQPTMTMDVDGNKGWYINSKLHRTDGPAAEYLSGSKTWWVNGKRHRTDGPACEWDDGGIEWYLDHQRYKFDEWLEANTDLTDGEKVMMKLQYG